MQKDLTGLAKLVHKRGIIIAIDSVGAAMLNSTPEEIIGKNIFEELPEASAKTLKRMMQAGNESPYIIRLKSPTHQDYKDFYIVPESKEVSLNAERTVFFKVVS